MLAHQKSNRPKNHRDNFNITTMYRISGHTYCSCNCIDSKLLQSIKLSNMPRNCRGSLLVMMWLILERSANSNWNPLKTLKTDQVDGEVFQPMHKLKKMHTFLPHQLFFWSKSKSKSKVMRKWNFNHIVINDTLFWSILKKMNAGGKMSRWFWQWTMNTYWPLSRSVSSWYLADKILAAEADNLNSVHFSYYNFFCVQ